MEAIKNKISTLIPQESLRPEFKHLHNSFCQVIADQVSKGLPEYFKIEIASGDEPVIIPHEKQESFVEKYGRTFLESQSPPTFRELVDNVVSSPSYKTFLA